MVLSKQVSRREYGAGFTDTLVNVPRKTLTRLRNSVPQPPRPLSVLPIVGASDKVTAVVVHAAVVRQVPVAVQVVGQ